MRRIAAIGVCALTVLLCAACASNPEAPEITTVSATHPETESPIPTPSGVASDEPAPTITEFELTDQVPSFSDPTGEIGCYLVAWEEDGTSLVYARCDHGSSPVSKKVLVDFGQCKFDADWRMDPAGLGLESDFGPDVACGSDSARGGPALVPGAGYRVGTVECFALDVGVTCRETKLGTGFTLTPDDYKFF